MSEVPPVNAVTVTLAEQTFTVPAGMVRFYWPVADLAPVRWALLQERQEDGMIPYLRASMSSKRTKLVANGSSAWGWPVELAPLDWLDSLTEEERKALKPTRKPCADCGTRKGKLRRWCPYCGAPVCGACWPLDHVHKGR